MKSWKIAAPELVLTRLVLTGLVAGLFCASAMAQANPNNSTQNPYVGSVEAVAVTRAG